MQCGAIDATHQGLPHSKLGDVIVVLIHICCCAANYALIKAVAIVCDISFNLYSHFPSARPSEVLDLKCKQRFA